MRKVLLLLLAGAVVAATSRTRTAEAVFVSANTVVATSHFKNGPGTVELNEVELINGHGLDNLNLGVAAKHFGSIGASNPIRNVWHAGVAAAGGSTGMGAAMANVAAQHLDFGFDTAVDLTGIHIWQYSQFGTTPPTSLLPRGVNAFDLYVSSTTSGEDFVAVGGTQNLALGTVGATATTYSQTVQTFPLVASSVRRVRLDILSAHSGNANEYVGLDEVHFEAASPIAPDFEFSIDRATGAISLRNDGASAQVIGYTLRSTTRGALLPSDWTSIADTYDADNNMTVDPNDTWLEVTGPTSRTELTESEMGGSGPHDGAVVGSTPIALGTAWIQNPIEDVTAEIMLLGGGIQGVPVAFTGNSGNALPSGDMNFDGVVTPTDWPIYVAGLGRTLSGMSKAESYQAGDLDGDFDNDLMDFGLFKTAFDGGNGSGAFDAFLASVPEPSALLLVGFAAIAFTAKRIRCARFGITGVIACLALASTAASSRAEFFSANSVTATSTFTGGLTLDANDLINGAGLNAISAAGLHNGVNTDLWHAGVVTAGAVTGNGNQLANVAGQYLDFLFQLPVELSNIHIWQFSQQHPTSDFSSRGVNAFSLWVSSTTSGEDFVQVGGSLNLNPTASVLQSPNLFLEPAQSFPLVASNVRRVRLDIDTAHSALPTEFVGLDEVHFEGILPKLTLDVDRTTGAVQMRNPTGVEFAINGYEIKSALESLNPLNPPAGWNSLDDQNLDSIGGGTGQSWTEGGGSTASILTEAYLLGNSLVSATEVIPLGLAYNTTVGATDLAFKYRTTDGVLHTGAINYIPPVSGSADYNGDGHVDAADYVVWRKNPSAHGDAAGYTAWRQAFGGSGMGSLGGANAVPEPCALSTVVGVLLIAGASRRSFRVAAIC
jgi:hypothetical protein